MLANLLWTCGFILAGIAFLRFGLPALKQFDADNVRRIAEQETETSDPHAHVKHALRVAGEQVEEITPVQTGKITQYLFQAQIFATQAEAEEARAEHVGIIARRFYQELPAALAGSSARGRMSARERASKKWSPRRDGDETPH